MSKPHDTTPAEIEAALTKNTKYAADPADRSAVSREECARWRRRRAAGEGPATIARDVDWKRSTVKEHIAGRLCPHPGAEEHPR